MGSTQEVADAARVVVAGLETAAPDTGDDATQVALDDALDLLEDRLRRLCARSAPRRAPRGPEPA